VTILADIECDAIEFGVKERDRQASLQLVAWRYTDCHQLAIKAQEIEIRRAR
jgi:hypothetical protein